MTLTVSAHDDMPAVLDDGLDLATDPDYTVEAHTAMVNAGREAWAALSTEQRTVLLAMVVAASHDDEVARELVG